MPAVRTEPLTAEQELVLSCLNLARKLVNAAKPRWQGWLTREEADSFAYLQLCKAARNYRPTFTSKQTGQPVKFSSYAGRCITDQFRVCHLREASLIRVPQDVLEKQRPNHAKADALPEQLEGLKTISFFGSKEYGDKGDEDGSIFPVAQVEDDSLEAADRFASIARTVRQALKLMTADEREAVCLRYGLPPHDRCYKLQEIGDRMGIVKEWARQLVRQGLLRAGKDLKQQVDESEIFS